MGKFGLKHGVLLLSVLLCFLPAVVAYADDTLSGSFTVVGNNIILAAGNPTYTSLTLTWNSPQSTSSWGPATEYDIRYSLSPIDTEAAWQSAIQLSNPPIPGPPGSPETFIVTKLNPCTTYYFAIKAADANGNWTPLSNSPQGKTLCNPGGGGGSLPTEYATCPLMLTSDIKGEMITVRMTRDGVLCETCLAKDTSGKYTLQLDKGTKVTLADNTVPLILRLRETPDKPPTPENTVIVGPVYEITAYSSISAATPSPISISPPARLILTYPPDELPKNTTEVFIARYDAEEGWLALASVPDVTPETGRAHAQLSHFSLFAVSAKIAEPAPAKFEVSNLTVSPSQAQLNQEVTISINVANTSSTSGDYNLELKVNGISRETKQVTVAAGTSQTVNFTISRDAVGKHQVEIAGLVGEFEVIKSAAPSVINWRLMGSITILVLAIWSIVGWRWLKGRKKTAPVAAASTEKSTDKSTE